MKRCRLSVEYGIRLFYSSLFIIAYPAQFVKCFLKFFRANGACRIAADSVFALFAIYVPTVFLLYAGYMEIL